MNIINSVKHAKKLLDQVSSHHSITEHAEITELLKSLNSELDSIYFQAKQLTKTESEARLSENKPEIKAGCYLFENEKGFFCPHCYDNHQIKIVTTRINSKLRVCPNCRESIK